ncbi:DgyrCDS9408 [Dimorphilus gyrociliatus]|uniref:DgyrCDS9408 n=1 Tax=Dimorphilus gyrociliatus TaxID=2664684 RepID=A0A7I8VY77_9ANNE|nr:DgyrCDS9408 [Dimorphilus gyrociliatus]
MRVMCVMAWLIVHFFLIYIFYMVSYSSSSSKIVTIVGLLLALTLEVIAYHYMLKVRKDDKPKEKQKKKKVDEKLPLPLPSSASLSSSSSSLSSTSSSSSSLAREHGAIRRGREDYSLYPTVRRTNTTIRSAFDPRYETPTSIQALSNNAREYNIFSPVGKGGRKNSAETVWPNKEFFNEIMKASWNNKERYTKATAMSERLAPDEDGNRRLNDKNVRKAMRNNPLNISRERNIIHCPIPLKKVTNAQRVATRRSDLEYKPPSDERRADEEMKGGRESGHEIFNAKASASGKQNPTEEKILEKIQAFDDYVKSSGLILLTSGGKVSKGQRRRTIALGVKLTDYMKKYVPGSLNSVDFSDESYERKWEDFHSEISDMNG